MAEVQPEQGGGAGSAAASKGRSHQDSSEHDDGSTTRYSASSSEQGSVRGRASRPVQKGKERAHNETAGQDVDHRESEDDESEDEDDDDDGDGDEEDDDEDEEDEEPRLKYARLTQSLGGVYRNGDATSAFLVAGDKMIVGTHNGNIHVFQLPSFSPLRVYHAHSASITAISISPFPPPMPNLQPEQLSKLFSESTNASRPTSLHSDTALPHASPRKARGPPAVLNTPSNNIYIATSSTDGNVCIQSLVDIKDVQLRNFGRPVQAVALSPDYRQDRTYLSGGLSGNLILTVGGQSGRSTSTTVGTAAAAASGWLGSMGLGTNTGKDTILHSGEGTISTIHWSLSGKYVAWLNEHGIKIMRTKLRLDSADAESAWKRIGHIGRPETEEWDAMATAWRGRAQWIDEQTLEPDESGTATGVASSAAATQLKEQQKRSSTAIERLLVGWGGTIWIINVHPGGVGVGKHAGERTVGHAEIMTILRMDCIVSGISLYTQNLLLVLAYCLPDTDDDDDEDVEPFSRGHKPQRSTASGSSEPSGGIRRRKNNLPPELRLIDLTSKEEVDKDVLSVSRFERLSMADYHLGVLPAQTAATAAVSSKGTLEALTGLGADMWNVAVNPKTLFSSSASITSKSSNDGSTALSSKANTLQAASTAAAAAAVSQHQHGMHPSLAKPGIKIFIHSPYDCILASKRDLSDNLAWLLEHQEYQNAWELVDQHPEAVTAAPSERYAASEYDDASAAAEVSDDFFPDSVLDAMSREANAPAEREKRRIGELWIKEAVDAGDWARAGQVAGNVLRSADRWEKWVWTFAGSDKFDEITNYIPAEPLHPPIPQTIYEVVLGHYLKTDKPRFGELLEQWPTELFDIKTIVTALESELNIHDVREDSVEDGERDRDWRIVMESLVKLHEANGRYREALKCAIRLQDADTAFRLIRDSHLADAVVDDIPGFLMLRVPAGRAGSMPAVELEEATAEAIALLVDEAQHGLLQPQMVVSQLQEKELHLFTFFYFRGLWNGDGLRDHQGDAHDRLVVESRAQLDAFADLAVHLFALFDRSLLMDFLKLSTSYSFDKATAECEKANYIDELVYLYSKTGQMKRALYLIIDRLGDVSQAIAFAKQQNEPDLWEDLLAYSMDKPRFIQGLLEEVGTAIDPITLVRRIPEGLEVEGLREGLRHIMKEHEIQHSLSAGVAQILRSEVSRAQVLLRSGQRRGIKFSVAPIADGSADAEPRAGVGEGGGAASKQDNGASVEHPADSASGRPVVPRAAGKKWTPGHCVRCLASFTERETDMLVGFACGHVFHLMHLLDLTPDEAEKLGFGVGDEGARHSANSRRTILGTKITHARLLKDSIQNGCPECQKPADGG